MSIGLSTSLKAQDPVFSQFFASPVLLNPAFAGASQATRFGLNSRLQWPSLPGQYQTHALSYDQFFDNYNSGIGLSILVDDAGAGIFQTLQANVHYAYRLHIDREWSVRLGIDLGYIQSRLDWDRLVFQDQIDPVSGLAQVMGEENEPLQTGFGNIDLGAGLLLYNSQFYLGLSAKHLNAGDQTVFNNNLNSVGTLPMRLSMTTGMEIPLRLNGYLFKNAFISPNIAVIKQGDFYQFQAGGYLGLDFAFAGIAYRHTPTNPDAIILSAGLRQSNLRLGYSYDITVSSIAAPTGGAHEISLTYILPGSQPSKYNDCFAIFR